MIQQHTGDLLSVTNGIIVHGCNTQGVMGSGVALAIRNKWPDIYKNYFYLQEWKLGDIQTTSSIRVPSGLIMHIDHRSPQLPEGVIVINAFTQRRFGSSPNIVYCDYDAIAAVFARVKILVRDSGLDVHFPLIGCGLANGDWNVVSKIIENAMGELSNRAHLWTLPA